MTNSISPISNSQSYKPHQQEYQIAKTHRLHTTSLITKGHLKQTPRHITHYKESSQADSTPHHALLESSLVCLCVCVCWYLIRHLPTVRSLALMSDKIENESIVNAKDRCWSIAFNKDRWLALKFDRSAIRSMRIRVGRWSFGDDR